MPFKSEAQHRKFRVLLAQGKISKAKFNEWMDETKKLHGKKHPIKGLPERVKHAFQQVVMGGLADKNSPSDFEQSQLRKGIKVEMEHTNNKDKAKEIAMDHLKEFPHYYNALDVLETNLKNPPKRKGADKMVADYLKEDATPTDPEFHEMAESHGVSPSEAEGNAYKMLRGFLKDEEKTAFVKGFESAQGIHRRR